MFGSLTLRQISVLLLALLVLLAGALAIGLRSMETDVLRINRSWSLFQVDQSERARLEGDLRATLGYGGLIHHFKNYVLRGHKRDRTRATQDTGAALSLIQRYREIDLTPGETAALDDIESVLLAYASKIAALPALIAEGIPIRGLDSLVKVDDTPALRGFETLRTAVHSEDMDGTWSKTTLVSELNSALGYGGAIHDYKNLILRKSNTYAQRAKADIDRARRILSSLHQVSTTSGEVIAIDDISAALDQYAKNIEEIQQAHALSMPIKEIDEAVSVNDGPALRGINLLNKAVAHELHLRATDTSRIIHTVADRVILIFWSATGTILLVALGIFWLIQRRIIHPIRQVGDTMTALADGDVTLDIPYRTERNEIGDMARALAIFRKTMIQRMEMEQGLESANEELNVQLSELRILKDRGEQQTAQAISLAENLAVARDAAERATKRAESDEKRIRAIVEAVNDAILTITPDGVIETFNPAAQAIFEYRADDVIGSHIDVLLPPENNKNTNLIMRYIEGDRLSMFRQGDRQEYNAIRSGGEIFPIELAISTIRLEETEKFTVVIADITTRKEAEDQIRRLALSDPLTGLANRNQFMLRFTEALDLAHRQPHWQVTLMMVDLDHFKPVNDTHGHPTGDALLKEVAALLKHSARESDTVARLGGDEFALILVDSGDKNSITRKAERIVTDLCQPITALGKKITIGASLGIASFPLDGEDIETLMARADLALYAAKKAGRNTWRFHGQQEDPTTPPVKAL